MSPEFIRRVDTLQFAYVCSFAPEYNASLVTEARGALRALERPHVFMSEQNEILNIDIHFRSARLKEGVKAHCFVDDRKAPRIGLILVNDAFSKEEQISLAFEETSAHLRQEFLNGVTDHALSRAGRLLGRNTKSIGRRVDCREFTCDVCETPFLVPLDMFDKSNAILECHRHKDFDNFFVSFLGNPFCSRRCWADYCAD